MEKNVKEWFLLPACILYTPSFYIWFVNSSALNQLSEVLYIKTIFNNLKSIIMGKITKGILGGFNGTVGTVIGGSWKGIEYMRSRPAKRSTNFSQAQLEQQAKFATVINFLNTMVGLIRITYRDFAVKMTTFNNAMSYHIRFAIRALTLIIPLITAWYK